MLEAKCDLRLEAFKDLLPFMAGSEEKRAAGGVPFIFLTENRPLDPLDRRGPPRTSICTRNQPRRPILRPFRGTQKRRKSTLGHPRK